MEELENSDTAGVFFSDLDDLGGEDAGKPPKTKGISPSFDGLLDTPVVIWPRSKMEGAYVNEGVLDDPPAGFEAPKRPGNPLGEGVVDGCIVCRWSDSSNLGFSAGLIARHGILDVSCKDWKSPSELLKRFTLHHLYPTTKGYVPIRHPLMCLCSVKIRLGQHPRHDALGS